MGLRPTQGKAKRLGPASALSGTVTLSLSSRPERRDLRFRRPFLETRNLVSAQNCHLDRSVPGFPATQRWTRPRVRLSLRKAA